MNYTLYIDESGDFTTHKGEWVIGGTLIEGSYKEVTEKFNRVKFPNDFFPKNIKQFHLTEFRKEYGKNEALNKASTLFNSVSKVGLKYYLITIINEQKVELSQRERTYRAMLRDLLAVLDNSIPTIDSMEHLDLIIASRTINGEPQTSLLDVTTDILNFLPKDMEYDLCSLAMINLINKRKISIEIKQANSDWGLVCSDFLSNITYHQNEELEQEFLKELISKNYLFSFNCLGNSKERRARIAARNKDNVLSSVRWIEILSDNSELYEKHPAYKELLEQLLIILSSHGSTHGAYSLLALIERTWRLSSTDYHKRAIQLNILNSAISNFLDTNSDIIHHILFKLRNLMLINYNHYGDTTNAHEIEKIQQQNINKLQSDPDHFILVADFMRIQLEIYINSLDTQNLVRTAQKYEKFTNNIHDIWQLLDDHENNDDRFYHSMFWIKRESALLRAYSITSDIYNTESDLNFDDRMSKLYSIVNSKSDLSRLRNAKIIRLLLKGHTTKALNELNNEGISLTCNSIYDLLLFIKAINSDILKNDNHIIYKQLVNSLLDILEENELYKEKRHPTECIWGETALLCYLCKDIKLAQKCIAKAIKLYNLEESNISILLKNQLFFYESLIQSKEYKNFDYFIKKGIAINVKDLIHTLISIRNFCIKF